MCLELHYPTVIQTTTCRSLFNPQGVSNRVGISVDASYGLRAGHRGKTDRRDLK